MAGSMKDIKLRIKSVESTMQITKLWSWWLPPNAPCQERVEHSRPYLRRVLRIG